MLYTYQSFCCWYWCRYSTRKYCSNSSWSLYCSPSYKIVAGINLAASVVQHPLQNCRLYYSQVTVDPQQSIDYVQRNRNKKVIYRSFVTNSCSNITSGSSFNALVYSGIVHPTAVLICPFIGAVANGGFGDFQWKVHSINAPLLCLYYLLLIFKLL